MKRTFKPFSKHTAELYLIKRGLYGFFNKNISIYITNTFKIISIKKSENVTFLYKKGDTINTDDFSEWIINNNYDFYFLTQNSKLKIDLYFYFHELILNRKKKKKFKLTSKIIKKLKNLFYLIFIKR
jgi:hypothetical protein